MKISFKARLVSVAAVAALAGTVVVGAPSAANAAPQCATANFVTQCAGAGADGAPYMMIAAANFNGTVFIWSHGIRPAINIPATLAPVGPYTITNAAEPGPLAASGDLSVINKLVAAGYGVAGSGFARAGDFPAPGPESGHRGADGVGEAKLGIARDWICGGAPGPNGS